jgi:hypothetical protein
MENEKQVTIAIEKTPAFTETWFEGFIEYDGQKHQFWIIDPVGGDYEVECRWFFKTVPPEVRRLYNNIIEAYKSIKDDRRKNEN